VKKTRKEKGENCQRTIVDRLPACLPACPLLPFSYWLQWRHY